MKDTIQVAQGTIFIRKQTLKEYLGGQKDSENH